MEETEQMVALTTLTNFNGAGNGSFPLASLTIDAAGDLFGTTFQGGTTASGTPGSGTVFEIPSQGNGVYGALTTLVTFNGIGNGSLPSGGLFADVLGDLFGTTFQGGTNNQGTVFEIPKTATGFGTLSTLVTFNGAGNGSFPLASLTMDAAGDLFGTTEAGGTNGLGTVFGISKTATGYGPLTTLATFNGAGNGSFPFGGLVADAAGDLFGTTFQGGGANDGTVFEIPKTATGFGTLTTLVTFNGGNGANPHASLTMDAAGNLFGTTQNGGANGLGTAFEIPKSALGFGALTTLANFNGAGDGANPLASLTTDGAGDLFGTTFQGGTNNQGTVFEIAKTANGFALPTVLQSFSSPDGTNPAGGLVADAAGNLFGTTEFGGTNNQGTAFELTNTPFVPITPQTLVLPVFRFFDTQDGGHFFTTSVAERDQVLATRQDMTFEGIGYDAVNPSANDPNATPVYRFFDTQDGGHFFTISAAERDQVLATRPDLQFEGIGYDEHATQQAGDTPVYRFFETTSGGHFFTSSAAERDQVLATRSDMHFEGIAFFAPT
jgi:uncharacterized repeat protein (TIGR03803 family)